MYILLSLDVIGRAFNLPQSKVPNPFLGLEGMGWSGNWSRGGNKNLDWYFFKKSNKLKRKEKKAYIQKKKCSVSPKTKQEHLNCRKVPVGTGEMVGLWGRKVRLWRERVNRMLHMHSYIHRHVRTYIHEHNHERTNIIQF